MTRAGWAVAAWLALAVHGAQAQPASASSAGRHATAVHASVPAANFVVEWRLQSAASRPAPQGDVVITSGSAAVGGASGFGAGAVVVGTARAASPQSLRVANGKQGEIRFDRSETHTVYDMAWAATASASASTDGSAAAASGATGGGAARSNSHSQQGGVQSHEVVAHRVDGLRVTPHWQRGDTLALDIALTHAAPADVSRNASPGARASADLDFQSTLEASFDEWVTVATYGDEGDELQIRVSWR